MPADQQWQIQLDAAQAALGGHPSTVETVRGDELELWRLRLARRRDSSPTLLCAENADLCTLLPGYGARSPMESWFKIPPPDGILRLHLLITPSWSVSAGGRRPDELAREFALTNVYEMRLTYPDGYSEDLVFDVDGQPNPPPGYRASEPQFATVSPVCPVDLSRTAPGTTLQVDGWARGSAGVGGYLERRRTLLHIPD